MSDLRTDLAWYFDGLSAEHLQTTLVLDAADALQICVTGRESVVWLRGTYRTERRDHEVLFVRLPYTGESVLVPDPVFAALSNRKHRFEAGPMLGGLLAASVALMACLYFAAGPFTALLARMVPRPVERAIGAAVVRGMVPDGDRFHSVAAEQVVDRTVRRLAGSEQRYHVVMSKSAVVNAFALPGDWIVINCGLVRAMGSADELSGVIAHEMTHVQERHSMRNLIRTAGARLLISAIIGGSDATLDFAAMLGALGYMRADEEAADRGAHRILRNGHVNPVAIATAFAALERQAPQLPSAMRYLTTHPPIRERQQRAREAAAVAQGPWEPLASEAEWRRVVASCRCE